MNLRSKGMKGSVLLLGLLLLIVPAATVFSAGQAEADDEITLAMVPKGVHAWFDQVWEGFRDAAERHDNVTVEYEAPAQFDVSQQVQVIEDLIIRGVDGITISPNDDQSLIGVVDEALDAGVSVTTYDGDAPSTRRQNFVGTDDYSAGYAAGEQVAELLDYTGSVAILQGGLGALNLNERTRGFRTAIDEVAPDIEFLTVVDYGGDRGRAINMAEALLETYPDIDLIFGVAADGGPAAASVVAEQGLVGEVEVAGFDDLPDTLQFIRDGVMDFIVVQRTYVMGWQAFENLLATVRGESVPEHMDTGVLFVRQDNIDTYMEDMMEEAQEM